MNKNIYPGIFVRFLHCETDDGDRYYYWGKVIKWTSVNGKSGWTIQASIYENEDSDHETEVVMDIEDDSISDISEHPSFGTADLTLWGIPQCENLDEANPVKLSEVTIQSDPNGLRDIAYYLLEQAAFLEGIGDEERSNYHSHYRSGVGLPDIIVAGLSEEEDVEH